MFKAAKKQDKKIKVSLVVLKIQQVDKLLITDWGFERKNGDSAEGGKYCSQKKCFRKSGNMISREIL